MIRIGLAMCFGLSDCLVTYLLKFGVRDVRLWSPDLMRTPLSRHSACSRIQEEREERHKLKEQMKEASSSGRVSRFEAPELPPITPSPLSLGTGCAVFVQSLCGNSSILIYVNLLLHYPIPHILF